MLKRLCTALWIASASLAQAADGVYDTASEYCSNDMSETRITRSGAELMFYESSCTIAAQKAAAGGGQQLSLTCTGGGETWQDEMTLTETDQGMTLQSGDQIWTYVRCNG